MYQYTYVLKPLTSKPLGAVGDLMRPSVLRGGEHATWGKNTDILRIYVASNMFHDILYYTWTLFEPSVKTVGFNRRHLGCNGRFLITVFKDILLLSICVVFIHDA